MFVYPDPAVMQEGSFDSESQLVIDTAEIEQKELTVFRVTKMGVTCKDWSRRGIKRGVSGKHMKPMIVALVEIAKRDEEDLVMEDAMSITAHLKDRLPIHGD